ncbi:MAG: AmmeMemoRadiSam system radical SAM enzyme [Spirochaetes bacterium]|nr:MAG: AmmeMemoRadiSam system radical SAM enzyme [Spirochaetota bacterium]
MEAKYYEKRDDKLKCTLCPNECVINPGKAGICKVRVNHGGKLTLPYFAKIVAFGVDPIEKKPLYHYHPGKTILSIGFPGCSLQCPFCQNYSISQYTDTPGETIYPNELVKMTEQKHSFGIAYTYSEPAIHIEYVLEAGRLARERGLSNVLVSNGYLNPEPAEELLELMDAANIDLKGFNPDFYRRELKGKLQPVLDFITIAAKKTTLEVTTLVIPGKNDSPEEIDQIAGFLASLDKNIPLHLSCYFPHYKYSAPPTDPAAVRRLAEVARRRLNYVYLGNVGGMETNTYCPSCGNLLIRRRGYYTETKGIKDGKCSGCGEIIPIVGV